MGTSSRSNQAVPPTPPSIPRAPTLLDPAVEAARLDELERLRSSKGFNGTILTENLGGISGSNLPRLLGQ